MKGKITLVEDDPDILLSVNMILEEAGYEVEPFTTPLPIIEDKYTVPDLFILDKRTPDMDGLEVCKYLKSNDLTKNIPVIIISASPKFGSQALKAGAADFLAKPFQTATLLALVRQHTETITPAGDMSRINPASLILLITFL